MTTLTKVEHDVLAALLKNADAPQKKIATDTDHPEAVVSRAIKTLKEKGIIRVRKRAIDIDYRAVGYVTSGFFLFGIKRKDPKALKEMVSFLLTIDEVIEIHQMFGPEHDYLVRLMCKSNDEIDQIGGCIKAHELVNNDSAYTMIVAKSSRDLPGVPIRLLDRAD